jgi:MYXO-CTERM domain-containing protein
MYHNINTVLSGMSVPIFWVFVTGEKMQAKYSVRSSQGYRKLLLALAVTGAGAGMARAGVVFSDTFGSSTLNGSGAVTSTSTNYSIASAKDGTASSIGSGDLKVAMASTTGGIIEAQALFTSTPVHLSNVGDDIELTTTFTNNGAGTPVVTYFGLFHSGGSAPYNDLNNGTTGFSGLNSGETNDATGGVQNWTGYSYIIQSASSSKIAGRAAQSTGSNTNQDLLSNGASSSQGDVAGTAFASGTTGAVAPIASGSTYTEDLFITLSAAGTYTLKTNLYSGSSVTGTPIATQTGTDTTALYNDFDGLAMGWRETGGAATQYDFSSLTVSTNVPEPGALGLIALAGIALRRRK